MLNKGKVKDNKINTNSKSQPKEKESTINKNIFFRQEKQ